MKLISRTKKAADETKATSQAKPSSGRNWFGRKKTATPGRPARKAPAKNGFLAARKKQPVKPATPPAVIAPPADKAVEEVAPVAVVEQKAEPAQQPTQQEPVIPETVVSASNDEDAAPATPVDAKEDTAERQDESDNSSEGPKEEDAPMEPEGRNEEAAGGESPEKNAAAPDSREGSERATEMSVEDPPESTGLLCGCI